MNTRSAIPPPSLRAVLSACAAVLAVQLFAATFEFGNKAINHNLPDPKAFSAGALPGTNDYVQLDVLDAHKTLTMTNDWNMVVKRMIIKGGNRTAGKTGSVHFVGTGYDFAMLARDEDSVYDGGPLSLQTYSGNAYAMVWLDNPSDNKAAVCRLTDADFTLYAHEDSSGTMNLDAGIYNFYDPDGVGDADYRFNVGNASVTSIVTCANATTVKVSRAQIGYTAWTPQHEFYMRGGRFEAASTLTTGKSVVEFTDGAYVDVGSSISLQGGTRFRLDSGSILKGGAELKFSGTTGVVSGVGTRLELSGALKTIGKTFVFENGAAAKVVGFAAEESSSTGGIVIASSAIVTNLANATLDAPRARPFVRVNGGKLWSPSYGIFLGVSNNGLLEVVDGVCNVNGGEGIVLGGNGGNATVDISGGDVTFSRVRMARGSGSGSTLFRQTGGKVTLSTSYGYFLFFQSCTNVRNGTHTIQLDGGEMTATYFDGAKTYGNSVITADGGTIHAQASNSTFMHDFEKAEVGAKGLTVDTAGYNVTQAQGFTNKDGESGRYVKTGDGTLTLSATDWDVSNTVVAGGTLKFAASADFDTTLVVTNGGMFSLAGTATKATVDALVVTNGVFVLDPGDSIEVEGSMDVSGLRIQWTSLPESAQAFLAVKGEISDSQLRELKRVYYENSLASGKHAVISVVYDDVTHTTTVTTAIEDDEPLSAEATWTGSGAWAQSANWENAVKPDAAKVAVFGAGASGQNVTVADGDVAGALSFTGGAYSLSGAEALRIDGEPGGARIGVAAGSHAISAPLDVLSTLPVEIGSGAQLALNGDVVAPGVVKTGRGRLVLGGTMDALHGFESYDGMVTVTNAAAFGSSPDDTARIVAGTLEFKHPAGEPMTIDSTVTLAGPSNKAAVVYKADTDVTLTKTGQNAGLIYKRGAGTLTIDVPAGATRVFSWSNPQADTTSTTVVFPADGSAPSGTWAPLCIAEGELRFVGHGDSKINLSGAIKLGVPVASSLAQAALTVDGIYFDASGTIPYLGYCATTAGNNMHPVIRVLNGGVLHFTGAQPAYSCTENGTTVTFALTNGTYKLGSSAYAWLSRGRVNSAGTHAFVRYLMNASQFLLPGGIMNGSVIIDADNGSYFGKADGTPTTLTWSNPDRIYGEIFFRNGSTFGLGSITEASGQTRDLTIAFDDAEWLYDSEHGDKEWPASAYGHILYEMRGKGVIMKPSAGHTFTTLAPFTGTGGLVVDGEGTVAFGENTAQFTGTLDVRQGTADFSSNGGAAAFKSAKGAGTVSGASTGALTLPIELLPDGTSSNSLMFANCTFGGGVKVDLGRTAETALAMPYPKNVLVARYAGAAPDVSSWRLVGTGVKGVRGKFTAANGEVRMDVEPAGSLLIVY